MEHREAQPAGHLAFVQDLLSSWSSTTVCIPKSRLSHHDPIEEVTAILSPNHAVPSCAISLDPNPDPRLEKFAFVRFADPKLCKSFINLTAAELRCFAVEIYGRQNSDGVPRERSVSEDSSRFTLEIGHAQDTPAPLIAYALRGAGVVTRVVLDEVRGIAYVQFLVDGEAGRRKKSRAELEESRLAYKVEAAKAAGDRTGWRRSGNGDKSTTFRKWLVETYSASFLNSGSGVLDIAGGNGELAFKLVNFGGVTTTIVDPRPYNLLRMLKHVTKDYVARLYQRYRRNGGSPCIPLPLPQHIRCWFTSPAVSEEQLETSNETYANAAEALESGPEAREELKLRMKTCSMIIGMHPDQATEPIVDNAVFHGKPFAVVPCCVFPKLFPARANVKTHTQFCAYLASKANKAVSNDNSYTTRTSRLDFNGRNTVIYLDPVSTVDAH